MEILSHLPGIQMRSRFTHASFIPDLIIRIDYDMTVTCYLDYEDGDALIPFNVAFIHYVKQMMEVFYNAKS